MRPSTLNHLSAALMVEALLDGPSSIYEIAHETGVSYTTTRRYIRALRNRGCIHVAAWDVDTRGRRTVRSYSMGRKPDAHRPRPVTGKERQTRARERASGLREAMAALA